MNIGIKTSYLYCTYSLAMKRKCRLISANFTVFFSSTEQQTTSWHLTVSYIVCWKFKFCVQCENLQDESWISTKGNFVVQVFAFCLLVWFFAFLRGLFIQVIKSRRMRWVGKPHEWGKQEMHTGFLRGNMKTLLYFWNRFVKFLVYQIFEMSQYFLCSNWHVFTVSIEGLT